MVMSGNFVQITLMCASIQTDSVDKCKEIIYNVTILHRSSIVTVSSNDQGQQNMWA